jgi:hypothetical protein
MTYFRSNHHLFAKIGNNKYFSEYTLEFHTSFGTAVKLILKNIEGTTLKCLY